MEKSIFSKNFALLIFGILTILSGTLEVSAQATSLPLVGIEVLQYQGAFIIPDGDFGESRSDYCAGTIEYNASNHSLFLAGKKEDGAIGEFAIPTVVNDTILNMLNSATVLQDFKKVMSLTPDSNPQSIDRVAGLMLHNGKLIVNGVEYYDAPANNTHTTMVMDNASSLSTSTFQGYYELAGAAHIAGWMSDIPQDWQTLLGGNHISGNSSRYAISGRLSLGPTAFVFDPATLSGTPSGIIPTTALLDFSLTEKLFVAYDTVYDNAYYNLLEVNGTTFSGHTFQDAMAIVGDNDLWTVESKASYGFIVPGTRTYLTIGSAGGHNSGIGYKATQDNGNLCGGPCAYDHEDYYNYYWLWDVNDLLDVKNGAQLAHDIRPYSYGEFDAPFQTDVWSGGGLEHHPISGASFDPASGLLYMTIYDGGASTQYAKNPVIAVYDVNIATAAENADDTALGASINPNPSANYFSISLRSGIFKKAMVYDISGQELIVSSNEKIDVSDLAKGIYFVRVVARNGKSVVIKGIKH